MCVCVCVCLKVVGCVYANIVTSLRGQVVHLTLLIGLPTRCPWLLQAQYSILYSSQRRVGNFRYFLIFSKIKNYFLHFYQFDWEWAF